jgi:glyoxylase-like metal-dependent hydrolase (beta-lactamase superfamily II)
MSNPSWKVELLLPGSWRGATSVLISRGRHHIVVDTGLPHEAHLLAAALEARGLKPSDVKTVINTHFHVDHVLNNSLFPSSLVYATQESYDWCRSLYSDILDGSNWEKLLLRYYPETFEYERSRANMGKLRKFALRWWDEKRLGSPSQFRWIERDGLPQGLQSFVTSGHVPGHVSVIVPTPGQATVVAGDALVSRADDSLVLTMIPHNREQFQRDSSRILAMPGRVLPGHDREFSNSKPPDEGAGA